VPHDKIQKTLEETLVFLLLNLANQMQRNGDVIADQVSLTTQQWLILLFIAGDPNIPRMDDLRSERGFLASEIAESLGVSRPNITVLVNSLIRKGLVEQGADKEDRRRKRLLMTSKGWQTIQKMEPVRHRSNRALFANVENTDLLELERILGLLLNRIYRRDDENISS
jgi:DNA-binding MarR family transcriptional regulator